MNPRKRRRCTIDDPAFKGKSSQLSDSITGRLIVQAVGCLALKCISPINVITSESVEWYHCCWTIRIYIKSFRLSPCEARRRVARVRHGLFFVFVFFVFLLCIKNDKSRVKNERWRIEDDTDIDKIIITRSNWIAILYNEIFHRYDLYL